MHVLVVNDDGIFAPGIRALTAAALRKGHRVTVYAPDAQRSAASHAITLTAPLHINEIRDYEGEARAYAVSGTPADCARLGIFLEQDNDPFDFALSGINNGANRGTASLYSGTVGAAMEASLCGIPSLAVSLCSHKDRDYEIAAELGVRVMEWAVSHPIPFGHIYNLNVPETDRIPEVKAADLSHEYIFKPVYTPQENGDYVFTNGPDIFPLTERNDTRLTADGFASLSVLTWNLFSSYPEIDGLNKE